MPENSYLTVTAWHKEKRVGLARCATGFHYRCCLSDPAVDRVHPKMGIGVELQRLTRRQLKDGCTIIVLVASDEEGYDGRIGCRRHDRCRVLVRKDLLTSSRFRPQMPSLQV